MGYVALWTVLSYSNHGKMQVLLPNNQVMRCLHGNQSAIIGKKSGYQEKTNKQTEPILSLGWRVRLGQVIMLTSMETVT